MSQGQKRVTYQSTLRTTELYGITPLLCRRCGQTPSTGLAWTRGHDDHTDPLYVGFQCRGCGNIQGMTRRQILRRVHAAQGASRL